MSSSPITRVNYFSGEALLTEDFKVEQSYHRTMLQQMQQNLFTSGIVSGLKVEVQGDTIEVGSGMAIDSRGCQLVLLDPVSIAALPTHASDRYYVVTISYGETPANYTEETQVGGYKWTQETPHVQYVTETAFHGNPDPPVIVAILDCSGDTPTVLASYGTLNRIYASANVGAVIFSVNGAYAKKEEIASNLKISAARQNDVDCLTVDAPSTIFPHAVEFNDAVNFNGEISYKNDFGIHVAPPNAALHVRPEETAGEGTLSTTDGVTLTISAKSKVQVGDVLVIQSPGSDPPQIRTVSSVEGSGASVVINTPLLPIWNKGDNYNFSYAINKDLLRIDFDDGVAVLQILKDGSIDLGLPQGARPAPLAIKADGSVGLGLPAVGDDGVHAISFSASGQAEISADLIFNGCVVGGCSTVGTGTVTYRSGQLLGGANTRFTKEVRVGDTIAGGTLVYAAANIYTIDVSSGTVTLSKSFPFSFSEANYSYTNTPATAVAVSALPSGAVPGLGTISSAGTTITFSEPGVVQLFARGFALYVNLFVPSIGWLNTGSVSGVTSETELTLAETFQPAVTGSPYFVFGKVDEAEGSVTSSGTTLTGVGTKFKSDGLTNGDRLRAPGTITVGNSAQSWVVQSIQDDHTLTLTPPSGGVPPFADNSPFVVTRSTLMQVRVNDDASILNCSDTGALCALPPALVATANGAAAGSPNTIAINVEVGHTDSAYALQVSGAVKAESITVKDMTVGKMTMGDINGQTLSIGPSGIDPVLTADATHGIGMGGTATDPLLKVANGDVYLKSTVLSFAGNTTIDLGKLAYGFASRATPVTITASSNSASQTIPFQADGVIVVSLTPPVSCTANYYAILTATVTDVSSNKQPSVCISSFAFPGGPNGDAVALPSSITLPVVSGDSWLLELNSPVGTTLATVVSLPTAKPQNGHYLA